MRHEQPETPKPVRRVGSLTLGVCLIAAGAFFLGYHFWPGFPWKLVLKIAPAVGLCMLGGEVLFFAAKPQSRRYDFLSVFLCLVLMTFCFGMCFLPVILERFGPETEARETQLAAEYEDALYGSFREDAPAVRLKDLEVWLRDYYGTADTLEDAADDLNHDLGMLQLNVELYGPYATKADFAKDCRTLTDCIQSQQVQPTVVTFFYDGIGTVNSAVLTNGTAPAASYTLKLNGNVQLDWTADEMENQTEEETLLDEENNTDA